MADAKGQWECRGGVRSGQAVLAGFLEEGDIRGLSDKQEWTRGKELGSAPSREKSMCKGPEARGSRGSIHGTGGSSVRVQGHDLDPLTPITHPLPSRHRPTGTQPG